MHAQYGRGFENHEKVLKKIEDDFCLSLAKALHCVDPPKTVGLYVPLGYCNKELLNKIQKYMKMEQQGGHKRNGQLTFWEKVTAIFLMIFYSHIPTSDDNSKKSVHNIFIHFSAWKYAGTDHVWAGLVTALCDGIEKHFGRVPMSAYRVMGQDDDTKERNRDGNWSSKKYLCLPLWVAVLLICGVAVGLVVFIYLYGFPLGNFIGNIIVLSQGIVGIALIGPAYSMGKKVCILVWNAVFTQKAQLEKQMNRRDIRAQLGFMGKVKKEVKTIISYLQFMETFQDRKFRVVLKITSLDQCTPEKVVSVLDAMNILLSDSNSPFISILVADLNVIVEFVENTRYVKQEANNGYRILNRMINLPFSVPKIYYYNKIQLIQEIGKHKKKPEGQKESDEDVQQKNQAKALNESELWGCYKSADQKLCGRNRDDSQVPLVVVTPSTKKEEEEEENNLIHEALRYLNNKNMMEYVISNKWQRLTLTIVVMARLMVKTFYPRKFCPQKVASWVILANQWPCRLSWILQCIEDDKQMGGFSEEQERKEITLLKVYETYMEEFDVLKDELKGLLELDGDPEVFQNFLGREFEDSSTSLEVKKTKILVEDVDFFLPCTVNLDSSLKRRMELERGSHNLNWTKNTGGLSKSILLKMSEEEICEKMDDLSLENVEQYKERLKKHQLNGRALLYSNQKEIRDALGMSLGDWVAFRMRFLDSVPAQGLCHSKSPLYHFAKKTQFALPKSPPLKEEGGPYPSTLFNSNTSQSWFPSR